MDFDVTSISAIVAAAGVLIGVAYYILDLRHNREAKEMELSRMVISDVQSEQGAQRWATIMNLEWKDYDDFERKYGSDYNLDNYAKRFCVWETYNTLGMLVREKLIEPEVLYRINDVNPCFMWSKFKDLITELTRRYGGGVSYSDFEFLNNEILRIALSKNPSFKIPETFMKYIPDK